MDSDSLETAGGDTAYGDHLASRIGKWADHPSWDPLAEELDADACRRLLSGETTGTDESSSDLHKDFTITEENNSVNDPRKFSARFRIVKKLGEGTFGIVFQVFDNRLRRDAAVKILKPSLGDDRRLKRRFMREAQAIAMLRNDGIIQVFDVGRAGSQPYIVMEMVSGPSLQNWLANNSLPLNIFDTARQFHGIVKAVSFAHSRGVLHRDLKPSNILLRLILEPPAEHTSLKAVLTDFGLAKTLHDANESQSELTFANQLIGTVRYMSPEQAAGKTSDIATTSDVFSLGVIFYEMLTKKLPFDGPSSFHVIQQIHERRPTRPRALRREIPSDLEAVVMKCLDKQPQNRYASAAELLAELDRYLAGQPVEASNPTLARRAFSGMKTHPYRTIAFSTTLFSLIFSICLWAGLTARERNQHMRAEANLQLALQGIGRMLYEYSGAINDGRPLSHERNLAVLLKSLEVHEQLVTQNPLDLYTRHRLAVAHYFLANGYARLNEFESLIHHREAFRDIVAQLLISEPDNPKYLFDGFMSNYLLAGELGRLGQPNIEIRIADALSSATQCIEKLVRAYPEELDYIDAYNSFRVFKLQCHPKGMNQELELQSIVDSSLLIWQKNPDRPLLVKPAIQAMIRMGTVKLRQKRLAESLQYLLDAVNLIEKVFPEESRDFGVWQNYGEANSYLAMVYLAVGDWANCDATAEVANENWKQINNHQSYPEEYLLQHYMLRYAAKHMLGDDEMAKMYYDRADQIANRIGFGDAPFYEWVRTLVELGPAAAEEVFPFE